MRLHTLALFGLPTAGCSTDKAPGISPSGSVDDVDVNLGHLWPGRIGG